MTVKEFLNLDCVDINKKSVRILLHITPIFAKGQLYGTHFHSTTNDKDDIEKYAKQMEEENAIIVKINGETYLYGYLHTIDEDLLNDLTIEKFVVDNNQYDMPTFVVVKQYQFE